MDTSEFYHAFSDGFVYDIPKDASTITSVDEAEAYCAAKGGVLASVETEAKKEAIHEAAESGHIMESFLFGVTLLSSLCGTLFNPFILNAIRF